jgi:osmotically-inducible protein OsmY
MLRLYHNRGLGWLDGVPGAAALAWAAAAGLLPALGGVSGCTTPPACQGSACRADGRSADARTTAEVRALIDQHAELGAPNSVEVQTIQGVVYLKGLVDTSMQSELATAIARQAAGVVRVENMIGVSNVR